MNGDELLKKVASMVVLNAILQALGFYFEPIHVLPHWLICLLGWG